MVTPPKTAEEESIQEKLREIYNAEIDFLQQTTIEKNRDKKIINLFVDKIEGVLNPGRFFNSDKTKETKRKKNLTEFLDFYQKKLPRYDTHHKDGNPDFHGKDLAGALVELREKLKSGKFNKEEWEKLRDKFKKSEKEIDEDIKYVKNQIPKLETSRDKIKEAEDDDKKLNEKLAKILLRDFEKDDSYKQSIGEKEKKQPIYSKFFYVDIDRAIRGGNESNKPKPGFEKVADDIETRVADVKQKLKEIDDKKTDKEINGLEDKIMRKTLKTEHSKKLIQLFQTLQAQDKPGAGATTPAQEANQQGQAQAQALEEAAAGVKVGGLQPRQRQDDGGSPSSKTISEGAQINQPVVSGVQQGGSAITSEVEKAQKDEEIFEKQVTVGTEVATIGGVALLGAVTIGTGGLILPIAVVAGTALAGAFAIHKQDEIGKQDKAEVGKDENPFQSFIQTHVVDTPTKVVTKPVIDHGKSLLGLLGIGNENGKGGGGGGVAQ